MLVICLYPDWKVALQAAAPACLSSPSLSQGAQHEEGNLSTASASAAMCLNQFFNVRRRAGLPIAQHRQRGTRRASLMPSAIDVAFCRFFFRMDSVRRLYRCLARARESSLTPKVGFAPQGPLQTSVTTPTCHSSVCQAGREERKIARRCHPDWLVARIQPPPTGCFVRSAPSQRNLISFFLRPLGRQ